MTALIYQPTTPLAVAKPVVLAIGSFDGVHRGHRAVLARAAEEAERRATTVGVVTYDNHPSEVLRVESPIPLLCSIEHKLQLLQSALPLSHLLVFHFDQQFAAQRAEDFLKRLKSILPFSYLNMGYDGKLGQGREGDRPTLERLATQMDFTLEYMPPYRLEDSEVSSSRLRALIQAGELKSAERLLGRRYSIVGKVIRGEGRGTALTGFPTANIAVTGLALPPRGVYCVEVRWPGHQRRGVANLGLAPTLHQDRVPILEVHMPGYQGDLYGIQLEVIFSSYLRPERRFESLDELRQQLQKDAETVL